MFSGWEDLSLIKFRTHYYINYNFFKNENICSMLRSFKSFAANIIDHIASLSISKIYLPAQPFSIPGVTV